MASSRPLGDAPDRSYANKLERFSRFIAPDLATILADLAIAPGAKVLDVGCGVGSATRVIANMLGRDAQVVGMDLSLPHLRAATGQRDFELVRADAAKLPFRDATFDLIWSCNTINHVADPVGTLAAFRGALRPAGRVVLAQSGLLPEMYFAWDAPLDDAVRNACHAYYRDRYHLSHADTAGVRGLVRLVRASGLRLGRVHTVTIERVHPLAEADRAYFAETIFEGTWGERLKPYLAADEWQALVHSTDPRSSDYCLERPDFHHLQTLTICIGHA